MWQPTVDGLDPETEALRAIDRALVGDARVLEVGCGTGVDGRSGSDDLPGVTLVATDFSPRFVELTAARGVDARQADICYLPFEDGSFDVVFARLDALPRARPRAGPQRGPPGAAARRHVRRRHQRRRPPRRPAPRGRRPAPWSPASAARPASRRCARHFDDVRRARPRDAGGLPRPRQRAQAYLDSSDEGRLVAARRRCRASTPAHVTVFERASRVGSSLRRGRCRRPAGLASTRSAQYQPLAGLKDQALHGEP